MTPRQYRPAWVEVDLDALQQNAALLARLVAPAALCAVVKADGYGHGALAVAEAALAGGARHLAVALVEEGLALRDAGIGDEVLVLSEPPTEAIADALAAGLTPTLYRASGVEAASRAAAGLGRVVPVQVELDTGMHRTGADPDALLAIAKAVAVAPELELAGLWTHFAVADEPGDPFTAEQLDRLAGVRAELAAAGIVPPLLHAANSAGAIAHPASRLDLVRCGIALYGHLPSAACAGMIASELGEPAELVPALGWKARLHLVRDLAAGERTSYGRTYELTRPSRVGVVPVGYHDGVPRGLGAAGGEVLVGGVRRPIAGTVTMDYVLVDLGEDTTAQPGDEVVLLGRQGEEEVTAEEWAGLVGTISYEVLCGIGPRVPRRYVHGSRPGQATGS